MSGAVIGQASDAAKQQRAARGGDRATPVRRGPIAGVRVPASEPERRHDAAPEGPLGASPRLKHPGNGAAHECVPDPDTDDGGTGEELSQCHHQRRAGRILRRVRRNLQDVERFVVFPERRRGVRQAAVGEGVARQQVAELVLDHGCRWPSDREGDRCRDNESKRTHREGYSRRASIQPGRDSCFTRNGAPGRGARNSGGWILGSWRLTRRFETRVEELEH